MPKISVIIPLYNKAAYVKEAVQSVLDQTYQDFEIIVTDDGSTDGSQEIVRSMHDPRIRFYQNEKNLGTAGNGNKLFGLSTGEYIARLDADDIMVLNRLELQLNLMENRKEVGVSSGTIELTGNKKETWRLSGNHDELRAGILFNTPIAQGASIIRHDILKKHDLRYDHTGFNVAEDWLLWYKMSKVTQFANLPDTLIRYRIYEGNISNPNNHAFYASRKFVFDHMFSDLGLPLEKTEIHFCTKFFFKTPPSAQTVKEYHDWIVYLGNWNKNQGVFHQQMFKQQLDGLWNRFFYFLPPHGWKPVREYFRQSGWKRDKFLYYVKTKLSGKK